MAVFQEWIKPVRFPREQQIGEQGSADFKSQIDKVVFRQQQEYNLRDDGADHDHILIERDDVLLLVGGDDRLLVYEEIG